MAAGKFKLYDPAKKRLADGTFDLDGSTFKMALFQSTSNANTLSVGTGLYADLTNEVANANGYTTGGITLSGVTWTNTSGSIAWTFTAPVWTASGGPIAARFAVIYASGTLNTLVNPILCVSLLDTTPADVTATAGNTLTITPNASGCFTLSGATTD
jgi:hypothetical protein